VGYRDARRPLGPETNLCACVPRRRTGCLPCPSRMPPNQFLRPRWRGFFEPFFRGDVRESRQGLGLGLHIASQMAKVHDGALTVTSTPEEMRFTFAMRLRS
jgi:hypothetical protein